MIQNSHHMWSYWEKKSFMEGFDLVLVGSGIVGLFAALDYKLRFPHKEVALIEGSTIPQGASTKNAGFACIGSPSELLDDIQSMGEEKVMELIHMRWQGLAKLRGVLGDAKIDYKPTGNVELFRKEEQDLAAHCLHKMDFLNDLMQNAMGQSDVFSPLALDRLPRIQGLSGALFNAAEGLIDTGKMMRALLAKTLGAGVLLLNGRKMLGYESHSQGVEIQLEGGMVLKTEKLLICTNAFGKTPAHWPEQIQAFRNQVFVFACPNHGVPPAGYHMDQGYLYFRTLDSDHLLIGGGRNHFPKEESTLDFGNTPQVEQHLQNLLEELLGRYLSKPLVKWSGIIAMGESKVPIVKKIDDRVGLAVRLGGMGVAIGSLVGAQGASLMAED
jgi:glycine/D-amino acid oxidase-like deaminating enzyme